MFPSPNGDGDLGDTAINVRARLSATRLNDTPENCSKLAHGFLDDYRLNVFYKYPDRHRKKLSQYQALITPDYSDWREMNTCARSSQSRTAVGLVNIGKKNGVCL